VGYCVPMDVCDNIVLGYYLHRIMWSFSRFRGWAWRVKEAARVETEQDEGDKHAESEGENFDLNSQEDQEDDHAPRPGTQASLTHRLPLDGIVPSSESDEAPPLN
jgi:hypothetical protein